MVELLSICIPTFNRKERLKKLLKTICSYNTTIPVIIVDNASEDGTDKMVASEFIGKFNNIRYFRNDVNLGHDGNFLRLIEIGKNTSIYSLWLGDDDCIIEDFCSELPDILSKEMPDLVLLNSKNYINNAFKRFKYKYIKSKRTSGHLDTKFNKVIEDVSYLFFDYYDKMPFGTLIVRNEMFNTNDIKKYKGTFHLYSGAIWEGLCSVEDSKNKIKTLILSKQYIIWGKGSKSYSDKMIKVCLGIGKWHALLPDRISFISYLAYKSQTINKVYGDYTNYIVDGFEGIKKTERDN